MSNNFNTNNKFNFIISSERFKGNKFQPYVVGATLPGFSLGLTEIPNSVRRVSLPGNSLEADDLTITCAADENLDSWYEIYKWITDIRDSAEIDEKNILSDASIIIMNNNHREVMSFNFKEMFPFILSPLEYTTAGTDIEFQTFTVTFKYIDFDVDKK